MKDERKVRDAMEEENANYTALEYRALLNVKEMCAYLGVGQTKCRELLANPANGFTVRIGRRLYAHRKSLDHWLDRQIYENGKNRGMTPE